MLVVFGERESTDFLKLYDSSLLLIELRTEPHTETNTESLTESLTESHTDSHTESLTEPHTESLTEPHTDSPTETLTESHTETLTAFLISFSEFISSYDVREFPQEDQWIFEKLYDWSLLLIESLTEFHGESPTETLTETLTE